MFIIASEVMLVVDEEKIMKKRNSLFLLTLSFCLLISPIFAFADETKPINEWFKRPSIAQFVADKLSLTTSDLVSQSQLDEIKTFNPAVGELVDMESFLEIASLRKLENIYLRKQSLKNFEGVENFKELASLMVVESPIESISGIEQLPVLTLLSIGYNYSPVFIENPSALAPIDGVPSLVNIDLRMLDLTNDHLSKLKNNNQNLRNINLHGNNLTSFKGLDVFPNLKNLRVSQNNLKKMDGIESLKQLEMLDINNENFDKSYGNGIVDSSLFTMCDESCLYYDMDRHKVILEMEKGIDDKYYIDLNQFIVPSVSNNAVKKFHFKLTNIAAGKYDEGKNIVEFTTEEIENINFSEDFLEVTLKDHNNQSYGRIFIYSDKPNVKRDVFKVVYRDGIQDEHSFKDQVYEGIEEGSLTPKYVGTPQREGYRFKGWSPEVSETVTENTVYVAQWEKNIEVKKTYEVVYRDGIQDEDSFKDQVYGGIEEGSLTPEYVGTPQRKGYRFKGWSPKVSETVTENTVYVAQWELSVSIANPTALPPTGLSNNNLFLIGIGLVLTSLAPLSIRKNRN